MSKRISKMTAQIGNLIILFYKEQSIFGACFNVSHIATFYIFHAVLYLILE